MIRITSTPKPRDRFGSIPIRESKPANNFASGPYLPRRPRKSFLRTWLKRIIALLLGPAFLLGLGSVLLVPYLATTLLPEHLAGAMNRPVTIARAEFNPLTATLTLHQLIVGPKLSQPDDPVDPLLSAGSITITLERQRLPEGEIACTLDAKHFLLHLVRQKDGGYNLGQTMDELLPAMPALPLRFSLNAIALADSRVVFDDEQTGKSHLAEGLTLAISPDRSAPLRLQAKVNAIPITLPENASLTAVPVQPTEPPLVMPEPAEPGKDGSAPAQPDDIAAKKAEAIALARNLAQAARQYLQPSVAQPTGTPLAP